MKVTKHASHSSHGRKFRKSVKKFLNFVGIGIGCVAVLWILAFVIAPDQPLKAADIWSKVGVVFTGLIVLVSLFVLFGSILLLFKVSGSVPDQSRKED